LARQKELRAKAKADRLAEAANAVPELPAPGAGRNAPEARRGSLAQMRQTVRKFSLMRLTKVLLDGTLVPTPVEIRHSSAGDQGGGSRIGTAGIALFYACGLPFCSHLS
jgi:hypothetical protein